MKTKVVTPSDRPWGGKNYQNLYGSFTLHSSGIYLSDDIDDEAIPLVIDAFKSAPKQLRRLSSKAEVTLSVSRMAATMNHNVCTLYGNWSARDAKAMSPHLEIGRRAFGPNLKPYMVHELCHLWLNTRPSAKILKYREFLVASHASDAREVTDYAHGKFEAFQEYLLLPRTSRSSDEISFPERIWIDESLCETVAKLWYPDYKSDEDWTSDVDLEERREAIREIIGLDI